MKMGIQMKAPTILYRERCPLVFMILFGAFIAYRMFSLYESDTQFLRDEWFCLSHLLS